MMKRFFAFTMIVTVIPSAVLVCVGALHLYLAQTDSLTVREAGGFGMYSSTTRTYLRAYAVMAHRNQTFDPDNYAFRLTRRAFHWPSKMNLARLANALTCNISLNATYPDLETIKLEYWTGHFVGGGMQMIKRASVEGICE